MEKKKDKPKVYADMNEREKLIHMLENLMPDGTCEWGEMQLKRFIFVLEGQGYVIVKKEFGSGAF